MEKIEIGFDAQKSLAKMGKGSNMQYGIGSQMMQLNSQKMQQTPKEIRSRDSQTSLHERPKQDNLIGTFVRFVLTFCRAPLDNSPRLNQTLFNKRCNDGFGQLAFLPSCGQSLDCFLFPLPIGLLWRHSECHEVFLAHMVGGYRWGRGLRAERNLGS